MARRRTRRDGAIRFEMAPLLDVVFILLIFFAVSSTILDKNQGMNLDLPSAKSVKQQVPGVVVRIDKNQRVYLENQRITESALSSQIANRLKNDPKTKVVLQADRLTPYSHVIRVLDKIRLGGGYDVVLEAKVKAERS